MTRVFEFYCTCDLPTLVRIRDELLVTIDQTGDYQHRARLKGTLIACEMAMDVVAGIDRPVPA